MTSITRARLICSINFVHSWIHDLERVIKVNQSYQCNQRRETLIVTLHVLCHSKSTINQAVP